jgi:hypothetical protein
MTIKIMTHIRKYIINAGNEIVSAKIIESKLVIVTYQSDNVFCSKIIKLDDDEINFKYAHIYDANKELSLATFYNPTKLSKNNDINCYFDTLF